ncbi:hypothetical protein D3C75_252660 [compost metagenome]
MQNNPRAPASAILSLEAYAAARLPAAAGGRVPLQMQLGICRPWRAPDGNAAAVLAGQSWARAAQLRLQAQPWRCAERQSLNVVPYGLQKQLQPPASQLTQQPRGLPAPFS